MHAMSYDQRGKHSTWEYAEKVAAQGIAKLPAAQLTLGLPFYGRHMASGEWKTYEDLVQEHAPLSPSANEAGGYFFNGPELIARKTAHARELGMGGVMIWEVGQDCRLSAVTRSGTTHGVTCPGGEESALLTAVRRGASGGHAVKEGHAPGLKAEL